MTEKGGKKIITILPICILLATMSMGGCIENGDDNDNNINEEENWREWPIVQSLIDHVNGHSVEYESENHSIEITADHVTMLNISFTWEDEPNRTNPPKIYENQPDKFILSVLTPWHEIFYSDEVANSIEGVGQINMTIEISEQGIVNNTAVGRWVINITCIDCGDYEAQTVGVFSYPDTGNDWMLTYYYKYHYKD